MRGTPAAARRAWAPLAAGYLAGTALLGWVTAALGGPLRDESAAWQAGALDRALGTAAALLAWVLLTWLAVTTATELRRLARSGTGARHRQRLSTRLAALLLGASLAAGGAPAAALAQPSPSPAAAAEVTPVPALDRPAPPAPTTAPRLSGWTPDRPADPPRPAPPPVRLVSTTPRVEQALADEVVVRRGDTLWDIAARHLGPAATAAAVAAEWPRWYAANRDVIGDQPDLIHPGQRLRPPGH